jgi:hypothetical protein
VTAAARTPTETVVRGSVLVNRDGACSTVISGEVVTVDMVGSFFIGGGALCTAHHVHERRGRIRLSRNDLPHNVSAAAQPPAPSPMSLGTSTRTQ